MIEVLKVRTPGKGMFEITGPVSKVVANAGVTEGLATVYIRHTSASLVIQENADQTARMDLERWLEKLVNGQEVHFRHTAEGPDDMPAHIKAALTATSLGIPIMQGTLALGQWQGIYLWEHRAASHDREVVVHVQGD